MSMKKKTRKNHEDGRIPSYFLLTFCLYEFLLIKLLKLYIACM